MILSILICSIEERSEQFSRLLKELYSQVYKFNNEVEILNCIDNKQMSVGRKRQILLEQAKGDWVVYFDDDDIPSKSYVSLILDAIKWNSDIDCIGINGIMTTNGENPKTWCHRLGLLIRGNGLQKLESGYDYERPIIHFNPVKRAKALECGGFKDIRYGEDMDYAERLNKILTKEYFINQQLFHYNYSDLIPHAQKYGIR
jgi:glycosyltransferase involved in cell wall biosynthesis